MKCFTFSDNRKCYRRTYCTDMFMDNRPTILISLWLRIRSSQWMTIVCYRTLHVSKHDNEMSDYLYMMIITYRREPACLNVWWRMLPWQKHVDVLNYQRWWNAINHKIKQHNKHIHQSGRMCITWRGLPSRQHGGSMSCPWVVEQEVPTINKFEF